MGRGGNVLWSGLKYKFIQVRRRRSSLLSSNFLHSFVIFWIVENSSHAVSEPSLCVFREQRADAAGAAGAVQPVPAGAQHQAEREGGQLSLRAQHNAQGTNFGDLFISPLLRSSHSKKLVKDKRRHAIFIENHQRSDYNNILSLAFFRLYPEPVL